MKRRVLIADDIRFHRELLRGAVSTIAGASTVEVSTGEEALLCLARESFDVVMLDIEMPGMSGIDVLSRVKRSNPNTIVGLVTGNESETIRTHCLAIGADFFIQKPINMASVRDAVLLAEAELESTPVAQVLIADDSRTARFLLAKTLLMSGLRHQMFEAMDGDSAARLLAEQRFDLAFLDINMPGQSGLELLAGIRLHTPACFTVLVTGDTESATISAARALKTDGYVVKPITLERMAACIARFKNARRRQT